MDAVYNQVSFPVDRTALYTRSYTYMSFVYRAYKYQTCP